MRKLMRVTMPRACTPHSCTKRTRSTRRKRAWPATSRRQARTASPMKPSMSQAPCQPASTAVPMLREPGEPCGPAPGAFALGHGGGQRQEAADAFRQALLIDDHLPVRARLQHLAQKGQEPAVPGRQLLRLEGQPPHRGAGVELLIHLGDDGRAGVDRPVPHEVHQQRVVRLTLAPELTPGRAVSCTQTSHVLLYSSVIGRP